MKQILCLMIPWGTGTEKTLIRAWFLLTTRSWREDRQAAQRQPHPAAPWGAFASRFVGADRLPRALSQLAEDFCSRFCAPLQGSHLAALRGGGLG